MSKKQVTQILIIMVFTMLIGACAVWLLYPNIIHKVFQKVENRIHRVDVQLHLDSYLQHNKANLLKATSAAGDGDSPDCWIAHGGGVGTYVYCNSKEAVLDSLQRGFRFIELDLQCTTDGELVAVHDWSQLRKIVGAEANGNTPLSRAEILGLKGSWRQTPLFAEDIRKLMQEHPDMVLVTDKCQDFKLLAQEIPYQNRMIVEACGCHNYLKALRSGFSNVALTAWSLRDLRLAHQHKLPGVVLSATVFESAPSAISLARQLHQEGCCIMIHWASVCDRPDFIYEHLGFSASRFYTDTWSPHNPPPKP